MAITEHSIRLFGRPGDRLPGGTVSNLDAARHFIELADELGREIGTEDEAQKIPADELCTELQQRINAFFRHDKVTVELDPNLIAKAAAGPTRIRVRAGASFSEYDRHQLLEHEAFVHSLTALNGRAQPNLKSIALNSPRITATQEGLATFAELMSGAIDIGRMKRISLRIIAIDKALAGADFIDVFRFFMDAGQNDADSFTSAMRVFRGAPTDRRRRVHEGRRLSARPAVRAHVLPLGAQEPETEALPQPVRGQDDTARRACARAVFRFGLHRRAGVHSAVGAAGERPRRHARVLAVREPHPP